MDILGYLGIWLSVGLVLVSLSALAWAPPGERQEALGVLGAVVAWPFVAVLAVLRIVRRG